MYQNSRSYRSQVQQQAMNYQWAGIHLVRTAHQYACENDLLIGPQRTQVAPINVMGVGYKLTTDVITSTVVSIKTRNHICDQNFALAMTNFYEKLSTSQVSLGREIEDIVNNSLWDLYLD